jgi:hypothetical protein
MEREGMEENLGALTAEIREAGFPESVVADLARQMGQRKGGDIMLFFEAEVNDRRVLGNLYLERVSKDGPFRFAHFDVDLGKDSVAPVRENSFVRGSGYAVSLREAVNLMEGRSIYREPAFDPSRQGYWVSLSRTGPISGMHLQEYNRSDFNTEVAIRESQLVRWLDMKAQEKLAGQLRQGDLVKLEIGPKFRRVEVLVEADPVAKDLRVTYPKQKSLIHSEMPSVRSEWLAVKHGRSR